MRKKLIYVIVSIMLLQIFGLESTYAQDLKKINIRQEDGQLTYEGNKALLNNQFLVNKELIEGKEYRDQIEITNETDKEYEFYFHITPKQSSSEDQLLLLENIKTKITFAGKVVYEGSAKGFASQLGTSSSAISLGKINSKQTSMLEVSYGIGEINIEDVGKYYVQSEYETWVANGSKPDTIPTAYKTQQEATAQAKVLNTRGIVYDDGMEYINSSLHNVLSETTWQFLVQTEEDKVIILPTTGDSNQLLLITFGLITSLACILAYYKYRKNKIT